MPLSPCSCKFWSANLFLTLTRRLFLVYFAHRHRLFSPTPGRGEGPFGVQKKDVGISADVFL